jgi:hypothetical protein
MKFSLKRYTAAAQSNEHGREQEALRVRLLIGGRDGAANLIWCTWMGIGRKMCERVLQGFFVLRGPNRLCDMLHPTRMELWYTGHNR